jgi:hypothetical protein
MQRYERCIENVQKQGSNQRNTYICYTLQDIVTDNGK